MHVDVRCLCIIAMSILPIFIPAQEWVTRYNGPGNGWDIAYGLAVDAVGNVYVTGVSDGGTTGEDYATIKYDALGMEQWVARYNGPGNLMDWAEAITLDNGVNVCVTGEIMDSAWNFDYGTVKYDSLGVMQWSARYNGLGNFDDVADAIAIDAVGNVYVTGYSYGSGTGFDYATLKYNSAGVEQWVARYNGPGNDDDRAVAITIDDAHSIYVTGRSRGSGTDYDYATVKYDSSGIQQWVARFNGAANDSDQAYAFVVDSNHNVYVTGRSFGSGTGCDYATVKYDSSGVEEWVVRYDGPGNDDDRAYAIATDNTGSLYVTGRSYSTDYDYATIKYDLSGVEQWVVRYDGPGNDNDRAYGVAVDLAGNVCVTGSSRGSGTDYDYATIKYDSSGAEQWVLRYNGPGNGRDYALKIVVDDANYIYVTGYSDGVGTDYDYATLKYSPLGVEEQQTVVSAKDYYDCLTTVFYGPIQLPEGKKCKVFDIAGRVVEPANITRGIYFIEVDGVVTQKVVKVR